MTFRLPVRVTIAIVLVLLAGSAASAQQKPTNDLAISWGLLAESENTMPLGWVVASTSHINERVSFVAEFGGNYKTVESLGVNVTLSEHSFLGGVRFRPAPSSKVTPFIQALLGVARVGGGASVAGFDVNVSKNMFAIQPGGGVDIEVAKNTAVRIQGDLRVLTGDYGTNQFRLAMGIVFGFGGK